jgi:hypothetical protein
MNTVNDDQLRSQPVTTISDYVLVMTNENAKIMMALGDLAATLANMPDAHDYKL